MKYRDVSESKRVLVCGGRNYSRADIVKAVLDEHVGWAGVNDLKWPCIVHGAASGADALADDWALGKDVLVDSYPANWAVHGRAAGPIRNQEMLESGIDLVIAFPGGRGTADMVRRAKAAGIPVIKINSDGSAG